MKVFISHSSEDAILAERIASALQRAGLEAWHERCLLPGDNWAEKVSQALNESHAMVVLLSPQSLRSDWIRHEVEFALGNKQYRNRLIPVLVGPRQALPDAEIPWILKHLNVVEMPSPDNGSESIERIAETLAQAA